MMTPSMPQAICNAAFATRLFAAPHVYLARSNRKVYMIKIVRAERWPYICKPRECRYATHSAPAPVSPVSKRILTRKSETTSSSMRTKIASSTCPVVQHSRGSCARRRRLASSQSRGPRATKTQAGQAHIRRMQQFRPGSPVTKQSMI